ncbi:hypothetical protein [Azospirillum palustre]
MSIPTGFRANDTPIGRLANDELYSPDGDDRLDDAGGVNSLFGGFSNHTLTRGPAAAVIGSRLTRGSSDNLYMITKPARPDP